MTTMTMVAWDEVRDGLKRGVGSGNFESWIKPLSLASIDDGVATFGVTTTFHGNYVSQNFSDHILTALNENGAKVQRLRFVLEPRRPASAAVRPREEPAPQPAASQDSDSFTPDERLTFDHFVVGKSNALAHAAARRVAEQGPVTFNPLFLHGGVGLGKTHLMHAIAHELRARDPNLKVLYISAERFMHRFIMALRDRKMMDFKELFRSVDVLMVDDVQFMAGKESTQEEFFHTFNYLIESGKQIVISADRAPGDIKDLEARIKSRLQCGLVVDLHPTDYELRLGILQSKIGYYQSIYQVTEVQDGLTEFLAQRVVSNVRVLEGALTRLFAFASLVGQSITLEMAQTCLSDLVKDSSRRVSVDEIQRRVADHYNIRLSDLIGPKRVRSYARPRQIAMYLCKTLTNRSYPDIGRRFGKRDHTTVMHGVKKVEELMEIDSQIADDVELLRRALEE